MARPITSPELTLLRSDTQFSKLYLAVFQPNTIYTARLNGVPSSNDRVYQVTYDGGSGTLGDVMIGMTLYVGTSAGAYDLGTCVIRKTPGASTFYIGLTSEITWADNAYLTIVDDFELWAKHATIASSVLSMDVDVGYSDQHADFSPVPVLGTHAVAWLDGATVDVEFSSSDSWVHGSTIASHAWTAPGSSASSGMATATATITYDTPGCYSVYCTVTAANGKTTTGVRHVFVYDRDANQPSTVFQLSQCVGDNQTGGWMYDMSMEAEASLSEIRDRALVVLFAEDWYGDTEQSIGPIENRENIVCVGRIVGESLRWDTESGLVHFTVQGLQHWLSKIKSFPVELTFAGAAIDWTGMPELTVDRVLWHILYWHSTALETMDFYPTNDTRYAADGKTISSNIWGQLNDIAFSKIFAVPGVDRFGRLIVEIDPQVVPEADRDFPVVMTLTDEDWQEAINFQRVIVQDCSLISLNAEEVNSAGTAVTRYSLSPGHVPLRFGEPEMLERALCASQANANELAGLLLGWRTNQYPDVPVIFAQNNRMIDCFPRQVCAFSVATGDTPRGVAYAGQLIPRRVVFYFDADSGYFHSEVNFEGETFEQINTNGDIPDTNEIDMEIPPSASFPSLPVLPDLPIILPGIGADVDALVGPKKVLVHSPTKGLLLSVNFNTTSPTWVQCNAGLTTTQYQSLNHIIICPNGAVYVGRVGDSPAEDFFLARAPYAGGTFTIIHDQASINSLLGTTSRNGRVMSFNCNPLKAEEVVYLLNNTSSSTVTPYIGSVSTFVDGAPMSLIYNQGSVSYGQGAWVVTGSENTGGSFAYIYILSADIQTIDDQFRMPSSTLLMYTMVYHSRIATSGTIVHRTNSTDASLSISTDNCNAFTHNVGSDLATAVDATPDSAFAMTPNGAYMAAQWSASKKGKSSDGGASWSDIGTLPTLVPWAFAYVSGYGTSSKWIAAASYVYFSGDFFVSSPIDKQGNILQIVPILDLDFVKVVAL